MGIFPKMKARPLGARKKSFFDPHSAVPSQTGENTPPVTHGYVRSFDGTQLFYSVEGEGKPLIFCYGLVCSSLHWTYQIEHFRRTHRSVWFDYRGHQNSDIPKDLKSLTLENMAKDVVAILDELKIKDAVLLGHSMGVNVVLEFCRRYPDRVAGMILANGTPRRPLETLFRSNSFQSLFKGMKAVYKKAPELFSFFWKSQPSNPLSRTLVSLCGFNPHLTPQADIELYIQQVAEMDPAILIHLMEGYENYDSLAWLPTLNTPTLILAGENDRIIPLEQQELIHQLIPKSELEVIRHGSHCPQMDLPDLVNQKIEAFLNRINYGKESSPSKGISSQSTAKLGHADQLRLA